MNTNTLIKCVEELKKDKPKLDYVIGILETLIDMNQPSIYTPTMYINSGNTLANPILTTSVNELTDEEREQAEFVHRYNHGPIAELQ